MLDRNFFGEKKELLEKALKNRGFKIAVFQKAMEALEKKRQLIQEVEACRHERKKISQQIGEKKQKGQVVSEEVLSQMRALGEKIKALEVQKRTLEQTAENVLFQIPNVPHESVPVGKDETENQVRRKVGEIPIFSFTPKDHVELGEGLGILDLKRAAKLSGSRFFLLRGAGAALERALIQFMMDLHVKQFGYEEIWPPFLVERSIAFGTGHLPKFEEDLFQCNLTDQRNLFMIPTAEVSLVGMFSDEILDMRQLPLYLVAYTACFRKEAGAHGKDTRGLMRLHQFNKVELVKMVLPDQSYAELELMVTQAEKVLQLLELPYQVVSLCTGDLGFAASKTYDLEVWIPSQNRYREISSCSNCEDFQARRAKICFRKSLGDKPKWVHTLNGSGVAIGRTWLAILENFQDEEGNVKIPQILHRYLEGLACFTRIGNDLWIKKENL